MARRLVRGTEEEVAWHQEHTACRNIRLPIGGKLVYVTRAEAQHLVRVAQECAALQIDDGERDARLQTELAALRDDGRNPLLDGIVLPPTPALRNNIFLHAGQGRMA